MPRYRYRALAASGAIVVGTDEAEDETALLQRLRAQGHFPVSAAPAAGEGGLADRLRGMLARRPATSGRMLATMTQELAALLGAGLELDRALGALSALADIGPLHAPLAAVRTQIRGGTGFADALERETDFPPFYVNMVRAGEAGGALAQTMARLSDYLTRAQSVRDAVGSALVYPAVLLVTAGLSVAVILFFVLPEFEPLFAESGRALPLPARLLMDTSALLRTYWWAFLIVTGLAAAWAYDRLRRPVERKRLDGLLLRLPVVGVLLRAMEAERFCRTLGTLVGSGVPLPAATRLAGGALGNSVLRDAVMETAAGLREGETLSSRLAQADVFPALTLDVIAIGEQTGKLDEMLLRQADLDAQRVRHTLDRLLALLVPVITIVLGLVVAGLIASLLVAILSVNDLALQ
jgi:general secretion pathway protein F